MKEAELHLDSTRGSSKQNVELYLLEFLMQQFWIKIMLIGEGKGGLCLFNNIFLGFF